MVCYIDLHSIERILCGRVDCNGIVALSYFINVQNISTPLQRQKYFRDSGTLTVAEIFVRHSIDVSAIYQLTPDHATCRAPAHRMLMDSHDSSRSPALEMIHSHNRSIAESIDLLSTFSQDSSDTNPPISCQPLPHSRVSNLPASRSPNHCHSPPPHPAMLPQTTAPVCFAACSPAASFSASRARLPGSLLAF